MNLLHAFLAASLLACLATAAAAEPAPRPVPFPVFDLGEPGASWHHHFPQETMAFRERGGPDGGGYYTAVEGGNLIESPPVELQKNRTYRVTATIRTDFDRPTCEVSFFLNEWTSPESHSFGSDDRSVQAVYQRPVGLPARTDGWEPFVAEFTTTNIADTKAWRFGMNLYGDVGVGDNRFDLADVKLELLPEAPVQPFARGEGVTFRGGPGELGMRITGVEQDSGVTTVESTAGRYRFDAGAGTLTLTQLLVEERVVAEAAVDASLANLEVLRHDEHAVVLANDAVTFGVQCDGLVVMTAQTPEPVGVTVTNRVDASAGAGAWSRMRDHHLIVKDDLGGFSVHPWVPLGSGRSPEGSLLDEVDFAGFKSGYGGSGDDIWQIMSDDRISRQPAGWRARWSVGDGERLGLCVMPSRPFDWASSFDDHYELLGPWNKSAETIASSPASIFLLWEETPRAYALSYGKIEALDPAVVRRLVAEIHVAGKRVTNYMSAYFYGTRDDAFIDDVRRWKDEYGIDGIYSDGLPIDWVLAYEQVRQVREIFPGGLLHLHVTGIWANGGPPLAATDVFCPFVETYADSTVAAENLQQSPDAEDPMAWVYPRFIGTRFRSANVPVGIVKANTLKGVEFIDISRMSLLAGGREWIDQVRPDAYRSTWLSMLDEVRQAWERHGDEPGFYERRYLPLAEHVTGLERKDPPAAGAVP